MLRTVRLAALALLASCGCIPLEQFRVDSTDFAQVPTSPFAPGPAQNVKLARVNYTPAAEGMGWRVDAVSRKLMAANPLSVVHPLVVALGTPNPEIFHADHTTLYITEGLVRQCKNEGELAAVLASELGRMTAEREVVISREERSAVPLPIELPIGGQGNALAADPTHFIEMAKYDQEHPKSRRKLAPPPDPNLVARKLLENAGFALGDLEVVAPLLRNAEQHGTLERQFKGAIGPPGASWQP